MKNAQNDEKIMRMVYRESEEKTFKIKISTWQDDKFEANIVLCNNVESLIFINGKQKIVKGLQGSEIKLIQQHKDSFYIVYAKRYARCFSVINTKDLNFKAEIKRTASKFSEFFDLVVTSDFKDDNLDHFKMEILSDTNNNIYLD